MHGVVAHFCAINDFTASSRITIELFIHAHYRLTIVGACSYFQLWLEIVQIGYRTFEITWSHTGTHTHTRTREYSRHRNNRTIFPFDQV